MYVPPTVSSTGRPVHTLRAFCRYIVLDTVTSDVYTFGFAGHTSVFVLSTLYETRPNDDTSAMSRTCNEFSIVLYEPTDMALRARLRYCYMIDFITAGQMRTRC